jgi:clan AA aspartic protease (TIGR02281 family)
MGEIMRRILLVVATLFCLNSAAYAVEPFPDGCKLVRQASLPFVVRGGHIVVDVAVNGHPLHFMVDTGGVFSAISSKAVEELGLHSSPIGQMYDIRDAGGAKTERFVRVDTLSLAHFRSENLTLMIADLSDDEDGVLAPEMLRNFDIELDFAGGTLNLFKRPACKDHVVYWTDDFVKLPMRITEQGHIQIQLTIEGKPVKATLDTGSPATLIGDNAANAIIGTDKVTNTTAALVGGSGGKIGGYGVAPDSLIIGKFRWVSPHLIATPQKHGWHSDGSDVLLGLDILHDLHLFVDYKGGQLYVSKR